MTNNITNIAQPKIASVNAALTADCDLRYSKTPISADFDGLNPSNPNGANQPLLILDQKTPISADSGDAIARSSGAAGSWSSSESKANGYVLIEQVHADHVCKAPNRPWLMAKDERSKRLLVYRPGCKRWSCKPCAERNRRRWTAIIANGIRHYQEMDTNAWWFVTLTTHEKLHSFEQQLSVWQSGWTKLTERMRRASEGKLRYVLLPELAPETNRLHQHMIVNQGFGAKPRKSQKKGYSCSWLHDNPRSCGLGYANDIKLVDNPALAAWYTAGYIGKALAVTDWPVNFRRVRTSTGWPELPDLPSPGDALAWGVTAGKEVEAQIERAWAMGYDVVNIGTGEVVEVIDLDQIREEALGH